MDYQEFEGKTVDEAIVSAMKTFRASFEDLDIQIISEGSKGLFGLVGSKTAKILAKPIQEEAVESSASALTPDGPALSDTPPLHSEPQAPTPTAPRRPISDSMS